MGVVENAEGRLFSAYKSVCVEQKSVLEALVLKCRSETFRLDKFFRIFQRVTRIIMGGKMKPRGGERDSPIGDLFYFTYVSNAITTNFLPQEINLRS